MIKPKISLFAKIYSAAIILLPFLYQYASPLPFLSMGDFVLVILTAFGLCQLNLTNAKNRIKPLIIFSAAFVVLTVLVSCFSLNYFKYSDAITIFFKILLYLSACAVCTKFFNLKYIKKFYLVLVWLFAVYLVLQVIYNRISGGFLPIYIKYNWLFSWERRPANLYDYYGGQMYSYFRPSSLFMEPSYYATFTLPALLLLLFEDRKIFAAFLLYITIVLSTSGAGIIIGLLAFIIKGATTTAYFKDGKVYFTRNAVIAIVILVLGAVLLAMFGWKILPKIFNSFNSRITRSFLIFENVDTVHKIFGVGMNNTSNYANAYNIYTAYDEGNLNYGASLVVSLVQYGIIGFSIFACSLAVFIFKARQSQIGILLGGLYIIFTLFDEVIFNYKMAFLLAFIIYYIGVSEKKSVAVKQSLPIAGLAEAK